METPLLGHHEVLRNLTTPKINTQIPNPQIIIREGMMITEEGNLHAIVNDAETHQMMKMTIRGSREQDILLRISSKRCHATTSRCS